MTQYKKLSLKKSKLTQHVFNNNKIYDWYIQLKSLINETASISLSGNLL